MNFEEIQTISSIPPGTCSVQQGQAVILEYITITSEYPLDFEGLIA